MGLVVAVDIGGTFTDLVLFDPSDGSMKFVKRPTTYDDFGRAIVECVKAVEIGMAKVSYVKHGTTLVINALLQRKGARVALFTTKGFKDILEIGRGNRMRPFDLKFRRDPPLVDRDLRFEIDERIAASGDVLVPLESSILDTVIDTLKSHRIEAVGISFLHSYKNPIHEQAFADLLKRSLPDLYVSTGSDLSQEWYEFERTATVAANAFVGPQVKGYIEKLERNLSEMDFSGSLMLMGSHGGVLSLQRACAEPIALVESGPVGGCIGAAAFGKYLGLPNLISFDMGGTTAKCALIHEGNYDVESTYYIGGEVTGFPIRGNVVDILEVGVGGGSIAFIGDDGRLNVGPKSAGSTPGPICYGRGGEQPTVTDANLILNRIDAAGFLGGEMQLHVASAKAGIIAKLGALLSGTSVDQGTAAAAGVLELANLSMATAIKQISLSRGHDPRDFTLFCMGGGGPLHGVDLARELRIPRVIIPPEPGNFSAVGMLMADAKVMASVTKIGVLNDVQLSSVREHFVALEEKIGRELEADFAQTKCIFSRNLEMRYLGQKHSMRVPLELSDTVLSLSKRFESGYKQRYGHIHKDARVEIVSLIAVGVSASDKPPLDKLIPTLRPPKERRTKSVYSLSAQRYVEATVYDRYSLPPGLCGEGPALIEEYGSTTFVGERDAFLIGELGEIQIDCKH